MDLRSLSAVETASAIAARKLSSEEATQAAIGRLKAIHETTNAVINFDEDEALAGARSADRSIANGADPGPLGGVPLAHKDMFDRAGKVPSWGAKIRLDKPCAHDAGVIARLKSAGALQIAALHLSEFAFGPTGHNYILGHAKNPWDTSRITGASSSGSAIAVASGAIPAALGSDTGGSLRLPAACCGIASIKPTLTRVTRAGAMPLAGSLDTVGALARDVRDLALMTRVLAGHDAADPSTSHRSVPDYSAMLDHPVQGLRIGIDEAVVDTAHPEVQKRFEASLKLLEKLGCRRVAVRFPDWTMLDHLVQIVQLTEAAANHARHMRERGADFGPQVRARIEVGHFISGVDYVSALRARGTILQRTLRETFANADVTMLPILADPLPTIAELDVAGGPTLQQAMGRIVKYTRPVNYLGLPTLALAMPRDGGLPNGFQLVGRPFDEATLFALGVAYQREVPPEVALNI